MRIKDFYVLQEIDDEFIVVPVGPGAEQLRGVLRLNSTGGVLWKAMLENSNTSDDLTEILMTEFKVDKIKAKQDVDKFLQKLSELGCLE